VGIGIAGQVDLKGIVRYAPNLKWQDVPLKDKLEAKLGKPVIVTNDVRAATWGEWRYGSGKGLQDLVVLFVGTGIGGGVVSGGWRTGAHHYRFRWAKVSLPQHWLFGSLC
jgi:glucokinase